MAIQANLGKNVQALRTNPVRRHEPTWGDVKTVVKIMNVIKPANWQQVVGAFGGVTAGPAHLQRVRNATAHLNDQSFAEVQALQLHYLSAPIRFPCEASYWVDVSSGDFAFRSWIDEMRIVAENSI